MTSLNEFCVGIWLLGITLSKKQPRHRGWLTGDLRSPRDDEKGRVLLAQVKAKLYLALRDFYTLSLIQDRKLGQRNHENDSSS